MSLNGLRVKTVGVTRFVQLPRSAWRVCGGNGIPVCRCQFCHGKTVSYWDTLAVGETLTYMVHMPEGHPYALWEDEPKLPEENLSCILGEVREMPA